MIIDKPGMCWSGVVSETAPITGADQIEQATVVCGPGGRWSGVVKKGVAVGEPVVVFMPDAIVPDIDALKFMEKHKFRVRMQRLRGCPSEVLIMPQREISAGIVAAGIDLTTEFGVKKHEKDVPACIGGDIEGPFPYFIPKTDEPNFQRVPEMVNELRGKRYTATVKYDGTSQTVYQRDGKVGACSRNWELKRGNAAVWRLIEQYGLETKLPAIGNNLAIQWECIGPGIQGNPLKLTAIEARAFNVYDIDRHEYLDETAALLLCRDLGVPFVAQTYTGIFNHDDDALREMARGRYDSGNHREGIVFRPLQPIRVNGERLSFKVINLDYKEQD